MSHLVSYKWIRRTQYITSIGLFFKNKGFHLEGSLTLWRIKWDFTWRIVWLWRISIGNPQGMILVILRIVLGIQWILLNNYCVLLDGLLVRNHFFFRLL